MRTWAEALRSGPLPEALPRRVVRRVSAGAAPQPWWIPRRVLTVVSADVDATAGIAATWIVWRPRSPRTREHVALLERHEERWRYVGGGSGPGDGPVDVDVLDVRDGGGVLARTRGSDPPRSVTAARWIGCVKVRLGRGVGHVLVGGRRIDNPDRGGLVAVWTSPRGGRDTRRPVVVALGHDGTELSRVGPHDGLDTRTRSRLREEP